MVDFDPYWKWLGIPPHEQPANYYRLLGVPMFEPDPQVIAGAADRQAFQLYAQQGGPYAEVAQHLLNELGAARACLLDAQSKAQYDDQLRSMIAHRGERSVAAPPPPPSQFPQNGYPGAMPEMAGGYAQPGPMPGDGGMPGGFNPPPGGFNPPPGAYGEPAAPYQGSLERPIPGPGAPMPAAPVMPSPMPAAPVMAAPMSNMASPPVPINTPYPAGGMPMMNGPAQAMPMPTGQIPRAMPLGGVVTSPAGGAPRAMPATQAPNVAPVAPARSSAAATPAGPPPPRIAETAESNEIDLGAEITPSRRYSGSRSAHTKHVKGGMSKEAMTVTIVLGGAGALLGLFLLSMMFDSGEKSGFEGAVERSSQKPVVSTTKKKTATHTEKSDTAVKPKAHPQPQPAAIVRPNVNRRNVPQDSGDSAIVSPTPYRAEPIPNRSDDLAPLIRPGDIISPESQLAPPKPAAPVLEGSDVNDAIRGKVQDNGP